MARVFTSTETVTRQIVGREHAGGYCVQTMLPSGEADSIHFFIQPLLRPLHCTACTVGVYLKEEKCKIVEMTCFLWSSRDVAFTEDRSFGNLASILPSFASAGVYHGSK